MQPDIYTIPTQSQLKQAYTPFLKYLRRGMRARKAMPSEFTTARFTLKVFSEADAYALSLLINNERLQETTLGFSYPYTEEMAREYIASMHKAWQSQLGFYYGVYLVLDKRESLVGGVSLVVNHAFSHAELGYWVAESSWGKGVATEVAQAVTAHGLFSLGLNRVYAQHLSNNERSGHIMRKIGMRLEGIFRQHAAKNRNWLDVYQYAILRKDIDS